MRKVIQRYCLSVIAIFIFSFHNFTAAQTDQNLNPNWDWRAGDDLSLQYPGSVYKIFMGTPIIGQFIKSPWSQFNAPDVLADNKKEDGWTLVARDFGTLTRAVSTSGTSGAAYMILYNKPRGLLRIFLLVQAQQNFSTGAIVLQFGSQTKTATLTHLFPRAYATDNLAAVQDNHGSALTSTVANGNWVWGDFPMAYDNTVVQTSDENCPRLTFQVIGTTETSIQLNGVATGVGGTAKNARDFLSGGSNGNGLITASEAMPTDVNSAIDFGTLRSKVMGTSENWSSWKKTLDDLYKNLGVRDGDDFLSHASNELALATYNFKESWIVKDFPFLGFAAGLLDFLFGGGNSSNPAMTGPTYFAFNLNLQGSAITNFKLGTGATIPVPAVKSNPDVACLGTSVPLLYNNPVGIFNLTKTPILQYKKYPQAIPGCVIQCYRPFYDFQMKDELQYLVNPSSGLVLDNIETWIMMDPSDNVDIQNPLPDASLQQLAKWTLDINPKSRLESTMNKKFIFSSLQVDGRAFQYQTIQAPNGKFLAPGTYHLNVPPDLAVKLKVVLHRQDNPSAGPVVMLITYATTLADGGTGNWPAPPAPVVAQMAFGWNFVSVPNQSYDYVGNSSNASKAFIYPAAISAAYTWNGSSYVANDPLTNGKGYWVKLPSAQTKKYLGPPVFSTVVNVTNGWNMIGSLSSPLAISKIKASTGVTILSDYFGYEPGSGYYRETSSLIPGKAYWIKVNGAGTITLDINATPSAYTSLSSEVPPAPPETPPPSAPTLSWAEVSGYPRLSWTPSGNGVTYRLYKYACDPNEGDCLGNPGLTYTGPNTAFIDYAVPVWHKTGQSTSPSSTYYYYVTATDNFSQVSSPSNKVTVNSKGGFITKQAHQEGGEEIQQLPAEYSLSANYPNPFNPTTTISYTLPEDGYVRLTVYNVLGQEIARLVDGVENAGYKSMLFDASNFQSGLYYYKLTAGTFTQIKKMLLLK